MEVSQIGYLDSKVSGKVAFGWLIRKILMRPMWLA